MGGGKEERVILGRPETATRCVCVCLFQSVLGTISPDVVTKLN